MVVPAPKRLQEPWKKLDRWGFSLEAGIDPPCLYLKVCVPFPNSNTGLLANGATGYALPGIRQQLSTGLQSIYLLSAEE